MEKKFKTLRKLWSMLSSFFNDWHWEIKIDRNHTRASLTTFIFCCYFVTAASPVCLHGLPSVCRLIVAELIETERLYVEELQSIIEVLSIQVCPLSNCIISILFVYTVLYYTLIQRASYFTDEVCNNWLSCLPNPNPPPTHSDLCRVILLSWTTQSSATLFHPL